jgi:tripartite-type tricarboxylate transporter receptor subunit TctC
VRKFFSDNFLIVLIYNLFVQIQDLPNQIEKVKWNMSDLGMDHNDYVNVLLNEFKQLQVKFQYIAHKGISEQVQAQLYKHCISAAMDQLVEGYSRVKRVRFS